MKSSRHMAILKIIKENDVETQYDLARLLQENGYNVTQATVSRDIKLLNLIKVSGMAMAVAAALDAMNFHELVGTIAGDDTIMCVIRTIEDTRLIMDKIQKIIK